MLVSIVTPTYNQGQFIRDTIRSVQNQDYRPLEHIIMDGASSDNTVSILKQYEEDSHNVIVKWVSEKDKGQANAVNKGVKQAQGDIVGWINSDDVYFSKDIISKVVSTFIKHPEIDIIHGDTAIISENGCILMFWCFPKFDYDKMFFDGKVSNPTVFFRKEIFEDNLINENIVAKDFEFWLRIGKNYKFFHLNIIMAGDRDQLSRISRVFTAGALESHKKVAEEYLPEINGFKKVYYFLISNPERIILRLKGLIKICLLFAKRNLKETIAFDGWIDSKTGLVFRQLTHRIGVTIWNIKRPQ